MYLSAYFYTCHSIDSLVLKRFSDIGSVLFLILLCVLVFDIIMTFVQQLLLAFLSAFIQPTEFIFYLHTAARVQIRIL
jgi:uncharacterized membrane protein